MPSRRRAWPAFAALVVCAALGGAHPRAGTDAPPPPRRLVAVGDIHGELDGFLAILKRAEIVDDGGRWTGGRSVLVQTGDFMDRGPGVRGVLDLLMRLEREAERAGGHVVTLLGNHEVMNLIGDWRDVTPEICAAFAGRDAGARRAEAWRDYAALAERQRAARPDAPVYQRTEVEVLADLAPGCVEYRAALSPRGLYGRWLRRKPVAMRFGGILFMHAGPPPDTPARDVRALNEIVRREIGRVDAYRGVLVRSGQALAWFSWPDVQEVALAEAQAAGALMRDAETTGRPPDLRGMDVDLLRAGARMLAAARWAIVSPEGPLWYRGWAREEEATNGEGRAALDRWGVRRLIVGHTVTADYRVSLRHDGRVVTIDTGMLAPVFQGRPAALEIAGDRWTAVYLDERLPLASPVP